MKSLFTGLIIFVILALCTFVTGDQSFLYFSGLIGGVVFIIAILISGAMMTGDADRAYYPYEDKNERRTRVKWSINLMMVSLPIIIGTVITYLFLK